MNICQKHGGPEDHEISSSSLQKVDALNSMHLLVYLLMVSYVISSLSVLVYVVHLHAQLLFWISLSSPQAALEEQQKMDVYFLSRCEK